MASRGPLDTVYVLVVISLLTLGGAVLIVETRPIWAEKRFIYEGNLTGYTEFEEFQVFTFGNTTITEKGWLWKTYLPLNKNVALYKKAGALVVEERTQPVVT